MITLHECYRVGIIMRQDHEPVVCYQGETYEMWKLCDGRRVLISQGPEKKVRTLKEVFAESQRIFTGNHPILNAST